MLSFVFPPAGLEGTNQGTMAQVKGWWLLEGWLAVLLPVSCHQADGGREARAAQMDWRGCSCHSSCREKVPQHKLLTQVPRPLTHKVSWRHGSGTKPSCFMSFCPTAAPAQLVPAAPGSFTSPWLPSMASTSHNHASAIAAQSQGAGCWKRNVS